MGSLPGNPEKCNDEGLDTTRSSQGTWADLGFGEAFSGAPIGLGVMDSKLRYVWVNEVFASVNGLPAADHVGRTPSEVIPAIADQVEPLIRGVLTTGAPVTGHQIRGERPGRPGELDWLVSYFPIRDATGSPVSCGVLLQEDTEHARTLAALDESNERTRRILETALDAVIAMDAVGRVTEWNKRAATMFGWTREEVIGTELAELIIPQEQRAAHRNGLRRYRETGEGPILGQRIELTGLRRDGTELPVELTVTVLSEGGGPTFSAFVRDITQRHETEAEIRASLDALRRSEAERRTLVQQLVRASEEERARLAGDVHDDSVQAMAAVGMRLESLKRRLDDDDRIAEVDQLQTTVSDAVSRLRRLLFELRPPALDQHGVAAALRELLDRLDVRSQLNAAGFEEPPDELRTILYRVAQESLANIRKHAAATSVTVALESDPSGWRVRVTDDGTGFTPDESGSDPTHMGLASMRERAEMGAGTSSVTSAPGEGTTVEVFLPRPAS
jgi:PAS domain S-box-containing protein